MSIVSGNAPSAWSRHIGFLRGAPEGVPPQSGPIGILLDGFELATEA